MNDRKPLPIPDLLTAPFWENARRHRLSVQRCRDCGDRHFPPGPVCPRCLSEDQTWEVVSGYGTLVSWVTFHRAYWDGVKDALPYDVCLVRLDEGPLLLSNFMGERPAGLREGLKLEVVFDDVTQDVTLPKFRARS
jgi:uncharacterized OB-fold protein